MLVIHSCFPVVAAAAVFIILLTSYSPLFKEKQQSKPKFLILTCLSCWSVPSHLSMTIGYLPIKPLWTHMHLYVSRFQMRLLFGSHYAIGKSYYHKIG